MGREPEITINGFQLTQAQAMALRVAACQFIEEMADNDTRKLVGMELADAYKARCSEVVSIMIAPLAVGNVKVR